MSRSLLLFLSLLTLITFPIISHAHGDEVYSGRPSAVITLTDDNFDELTSSGTWIISFYAPWCGHCKKLAPIFEDAANILQGKMNLAKVDCTQEKTLSRRFDIKSFPTLKFWRDGESRAYNGGRSVESLVAFGNEMSAPPVTTLNSLSELKTLRQNHPIIFVLSTTGNNKSPEYKAFHTSAHRLQGTHKFLTVDSTAKEIIKELSLPSTPTIAIVSEGLDDQYTGPWTDTSLRRWIEQYKLPLVTTISGSNFDDVTTAGKWVAFIVVDPTNPTYHDLHKMVVDVAKKYKDKFVFATIDGNKYSKYVQQFSVDSVNTYPHILVLDFPDTYYKMDGERTYQQVVAEPARLANFFADVIAGTIPATGTTAWYNPMRYVNKLERYLAGLTETQLIIGTVVVMLSFVALLIAGCWCLDIGAVADGDLTNTATSTATGTTTSTSTDANSTTATATGTGTGATTSDGTTTAGSAAAAAAAGVRQRPAKKSAKAH